MYKGLSLDQAPPSDIPFRFFFTAPLFSLIAGLLIVYKGMDLFLDRWLFELIALTHIFTLGWLTMIMMGAFYQMIPVMIGGTVPKINIARWVHGLFVLGVICLTYGIYNENSQVITVSVFSLSISILLFLTQITTALFGVKADRPTVTAMRISALSFLAALGFGLYLAGGYGGLWEFPIERPLITTTHIVLALMGWVGTLIMGVSFHVIPMFYMSSDFANKKSRIIINSTLASLILVPLSLLSGHEKLTLWAAVPGIVAMVYFAFELLIIIKNRKRKKADYTLNFWRVAIGSLLLSLVAIVVLNFSELEWLPVLFGVLSIIGFAMFTTNGMLYKIIPFLVWFHRFSHLVGKAPVPLLKDILPDEKMKGQFYASSLFITALALGIILKNDPLIRLSGVAQLVSSILIFINFMKINSHKSPEV